ncbi:MAG: hypothetical protein Q9164_005209 [Protoblastenia rupestris]
MLDTLRGEGYEVKQRELSKLRMKDGLMLRAATTKGRKRKRRSIDDGGGVDAPEEMHESEEEEEEDAPPAQPPLPLEIVVKRQARQAKLMAESAERLRLGTRRRRTKGWAGLGPDIGLPPRFPSELTLEESKGLLKLDRSMYRELRDVFGEICQANGVVKKTLCRPEEWPFVKEELINRLPYLQAIFGAPDTVQLDPTKEPMALDLICMDVTKRLRTAGNYISLIDAKNLLSLSPDDARDTRAAFEAILKADYFTGKLDVTKEHWEGLKQKWIQGSPRLQQEFYGIGSEDVWNQKHKALESIARDVQKRNRDLQTKNDPAFANGRKKPKETTPKVKKPKVVKEKAQKAKQDGFNALQQAASQVDSDRPPWLPSMCRQDTSGIEALASQALASEPSYPTQESSTFRIDPDLLEAVALSPPQPQDHHTQTTSFSKPIDNPTPISIYIRLAPSSAFKHPQAPRVWLETFRQPHSINNLSTVIANKICLGPVTKIEGFADGRNVESGGGSKWDIDEDDELEAYLGYVGAGKATFVVEVA